MASIKKSRTTSWVLLAILLAAVAAGTYLYRDVLRGSKLGDWIGLQSRAQPEVVYYCPMHPDYKANKPGDCPICNMALVKLEPEPRSADQKEAAPASRGEAAGERKVLYWQDPMNPSRRFDKPGKAPDGMDLVPVYADEAGSADVLPPGTVRITPQKQQLIGVQTAEITQQPLSKTIRTVGRLTYDETRIARIQPKIEGWIEQVYVDFTGKVVGKDHPLVSVYSPELVATQQELLVAKRARDRLGSSRFHEIAANAASLYESTRERLRLWDVNEGQIKQIEKQGKPLKALTISSPISGFVVTRNAYRGQRISPETELYAIADLSSIWVLADIYEYEIPMIQPEQEASMTFPYFPGESFRGKITYIYPQLDSMTRTLKVRLEFPNRDFKLKPDMYANVEIAIDYGKRLALPEDALLDSGTEQLVFVAREGGYFEPRRVALGQKVGNFYIVQGGIQAGERVVTSANFLIDSESQLKSALAGVGHGDHSGAPAAKSERGQHLPKPSLKTADHPAHRPGVSGTESPSPEPSAPAEGHAGHGHKP